MKVLITGAGGMVGSALVRMLSGQHDVIALNRTQLDITSESDVRAAIEAH